MRHTGTDIELEPFATQQLTARRDRTATNKRLTQQRGELSKVAGLVSPLRRYAQRLTKAIESTQSELVTIRQQLTET
jgi:hypothetical protein